MGVVHDFYQKQYRTVTVLEDFAHPEQKNMLPSAGSISFNVVHFVVLRKGNSPKTIMQQNEHLHIITL